MKKYYYSKGQDRYGPLTKEELKNAKIELTTLIWFEGLDEWTSANKIEELSDFFEQLPPPLPNIDFSLKTNNKLSFDSKSKVQKMFSSPFAIEGRIRRTEYGISMIIGWIALAFIVEYTKRGEHSSWALAYVPIYWFIIAQGAKRCHDLGSNGWWQIVPFYGLWMLFQSGEIGRNKYGRDPKN